jgi:two-component system, NtrC family, sensor kinase
MDVPPLEPAQLQKELRILRRQLERSNADRTRLEETNRKRDSILRQVIAELKESESVLAKRSQDLSQVLEDLTLMQAKLVESEKMAALGTLVAGIAHEINTPIGTSITLASTLADETQALSTAIATGTLRRSGLQQYLDLTGQSTTLLMSNLNRAAELIQSFKQVSVDQLNLEQREFLLKPYLEEIITSLTPQFKHRPIQIIVEGDETLSMVSYPGAIAQLVTNFITNSLHHAYPNGQSGVIRLSVIAIGDCLNLMYSDDGCGINPEHLPRIFDPFFTTARNQGGTGLGLHIVYNLVSQRLQGAIDVQSHPSQGTTFSITLPRSLRGNEAREVISTGAWDP